MERGTAVVVKVMPDRGEVYYACHDINEAAEWANEHQNELQEGERFDIYYRYEKEKENEE